jgi:uncharacterized protein involved in outer membrane biogenesis
MSRWLKITLISASTIIGLMLLSMLIVPWQLKKQGSNWIAEQTDRTLTIEKAFFNPFTLTVELENLKLTEQQSEKPFVSFKRLMLSGSVRSIIDQAVILDRVELDDPFVNIELLDKQEFNFSDFTRIDGDKPQVEETEVQEPLHFSLNNIILTNGSVDFTDLTSKLESQHQIRELALSVPFIGNIPYLTGEYVQPHLEMLLNGAQIEALGQLKPFHDSFETNLSLTLDNVDLAFYAYHSPVPLPIEVKEGSLDGEIDLAYRVSSNEEPKLMLGGVLALSDIDLREQDGRPLFSMPTLILDLDWADLFKQDINLASLDIYEPQFYLDRDGQGLWNFQRIAPSAEGTEVTQESVPPELESSSKLPLLTIASLKLIDSQFHFRDESAAGGFSDDIKNINLQLTGLSTHEGQKTETSLNLQSSHGLTIKVAGNLGINPPTADLAFSADQLKLKPIYPYLEPFLTAQLEGTINIAGQINYLEDGNILLQQGQLTLNNLNVPFDQNDRFKLSELAISETSLDLQQQFIQLGKISFKQGDIKVSKLADGSVSPLKLLKPQPTETASKTEETPEPSQPWTVQVETFDLQQFKLAFTDMSLPKKPQVTIPRFDFHVEQLAYPEAKNSPFNLKADIGKKGKIRISGSAVHTPLKLTADTVITEFPLADFNNFIPEQINLSLKDGRFYTNIAVELEQQGDLLTGSFSGKTDINRFNLRDPLGDGQLLAWDSLNIAGIKGTLEPLSVQIKEVALSNYLANIQITKDGRINLASITNVDEAQEQTTEKNGPEPSILTEEKTAAAPRPNIRIDALTLQGGTVSFVDRSMDNLFSATMYELGGRITGMASDEQMRADVDLRGQLENHSPLTISGQINPLSEDLFADLTISFKDIDLTPMTPYSGTYIGYVIEKGKLYLDLNYRIEKRKIDASNKVMIDQFTLGDSVESEKATSLPIGLAIALLKDTNDEIHLDVPVHGDLDDPEFSVAGVIFTVIKNLLVKAATSPFSLLSSVLGGGGEDFTGINFASGLATIDSEQVTKLQGLAGMLAKRPSLTLEISAFADKAKDPEKYRQAQLKEMILAVKSRQLLEEETVLDPEQELSYTAEEYPELVLTVYKEAEFPRPRNVVGLLRELPQEEMEKLLLANIVAGEEEIAELAKNRALAVRDALVGANEEIKPRIFLKKTDIYQPAEKGPDSRVEFSISAK